MTSMSDGISLEGHPAIVTGAGAGLGKAEALALASAGAPVVVNDLSEEAVHGTAEEIKAAGGQALAVAGDIGEWETGQKLVSGAIDTFGRLDILVNNAGLVRDRMIFSMSEEEWDLVLKVHLKGHFVTTRFATAYWREQSKKAGGPVYGRIVNTTSEAFLFGSPGQPNYSAAKSGITTLTVATARGCGRYGVRANAIAPRARTAMTADLMSAAPQDGPDPLDPKYVTPLVAYLASPAAAGINGEVFVVHGGVAALMAAPSVKAVARASENGSPDGMWTLDSVAKAIGPLFGEEPAGAGFACDETANLADETLGI
jgi:3-oxoacyl-[acyl-carrier protein] reductase